MTQMPDAPNTLPGLVDLTYTATTDPSRYDELVRVWEAYMDQMPVDAFGDVAQLHLQHFNRALEILDKIGRQQKQAEEDLALVGLFDGPAYVVDASGKVHQSNQQAGAQSPFASIERGAFETALADLAGGAPVALVPMYDAAEVLTGCTVVSALDLRGAKTARYLMVASGNGHDTDANAALQRTFGLSVSETEVLSALMSGATVTEISEDRGVGLATTRTQVRKLLEKTSSASLAEMVRQSTQIAAQMSAAAVAAQVSNPGSAPSLHYERMLTSDGRLLAYRQFGAPAGRPVLYIHNMMGGAIWPRQMEELAVLHGWRIIAPSRPGFGLSDSCPMRDMALVRQTCTDMRALLDHLGVDQVLVLGMMSSAGLAIKFAKDHSDRTRAVLNVGHAGLMDDTMIHAMANPSRGMAKTYRRSPTALRFLIRVAVASVDLLGPEQMLRSNFEKSVPDAKLLSDHALVDAIGKGLQHAIQQGGEAFSRDGFVALHDFRAEIQSLTCPAVCLLGAEDAMYPPAQAQRLTQDLPNYTLEIWQDAGQFVFYAQTARAFRLMSQIWTRRPASLSAAK